MGKLKEKSPASWYPDTFTQYYTKGDSRGVPLHMRGLNEWAEKSGLDAYQLKLEDGSKFFIARHNSVLTGDGAYKITG
ncbi:hypothetical protein [Streptomyces sp. NPDC057910]|uniref:hypothetical protein n=1 Tax=Streptomyces sp. NPDC057910 TaxID=3346278 RepID=UPI0036E3C08C